MSPRQTGVLAVLLAALGPLTGCVALPRSSETSSQPPACSKELPPARAADVCWAAAEEMRKQGYEVEAIAQYEKVREHDPRRPRLAWRLALLYDRQGNNVRAQAEYQRALEAEPRNADLLNDLGTFHYQREDYANAEKWLGQALAADPKHARAAVNLGLALGKQGRTQESLNSFARALPPAQAYCNVGVLLAHQGHADEARTFLTEALRLDKTLVQARTFLASLDGPPGPTATAATTAGR